MLLKALAGLQWTLVLVEVVALVLSGGTSAFVWACFAIVFLAAIFTTTLAVLDA